MLSTDGIPQFSRIVTLREYKEKKLNNGYTRCSTNINPSGYIGIDYVMNEWWIKAMDGRSYSCVPNEDVYLK